MTFKAKAIELYLQNIRENLDLSDHELSVIETAFSTGFNVGSFERCGEWEQELVLFMVAQKSLVVDGNCS